MKEKTSNAIAAVAVCALFFGSPVLIAASVGGAWGVRRTVDEYVAQYKGKSAIVKREDVRFGPDNYYILIDGLDKIRQGTLITDDGKIIYIDSGHYYTRSLDQT